MTGFTGKNKACLSVARVVEDRNVLNSARHHYHVTRSAKKSSTSGKDVLSDQKLKTESTLNVGPEEEVKSLKSGEFHWFMKMLIAPV